MTTFENKEVIDSLQAYFLENDPKVVARLLANAMIDFHRILNPESLSIAETISLKERVLLNDQELVEFVKNGPRGPLVAILRNSD